MKSTYTIKLFGGFFHPQKRDRNGTPFGSFPNGAIFKYSSQSLNQGAQGRTKSIIVYTPDHKAHFRVVEKSSDNNHDNDPNHAITREINLNRHFDPNCRQILQIIHRDQTQQFFTAYYSAYQEGGDLDKHQQYIYTQYNNKNIAAFIFIFDIMQETTTALCSLHNYSHITHNDIKPANILLNKIGKPLLADFGCAYLNKEQPAPQYGTVNFSAPELFQKVNRFTQEILEDSDKSDIYSLGVTIAYLIFNKLSLKEIGFGYVLPPALSSDTTTLIQLQSWGQYYANSTQAKNARNAASYLKNVCLSDSKFEIEARVSTLLEALVLFMQLPVDERPNNLELKEYLNRVAHYFDALKISYKEEYNNFISLLVEREKLETTGVVHKHTMEQRGIKC